LDGDRFADELRSNLQGDVLNSFHDRIRYSTDESIYTSTPSVIVVPKDEADVQVAMAIAQFFMVPITARGGGTSIAGQAIGTGMVMDFQQYFKRILDISGETATVQPGVILQNLNTALAKYGRRFAPDPGSRATATLGGMVSTNASGPHSYLHGSTRDHVKRLRVVLSDGAIMDSGALEHRFPTLHKAIHAREKLIQDVSPRVRKNSSGYPLQELCGDSPDYARFLVGSEGTLSLITEIEVKTIPLAQSTCLAIFPFSSIQAAIEALPEIRSAEPAAIELIDDYVLQAMNRVTPSFASALGLDQAKASLWVEWESEAPRSLDSSLCKIIEDPFGQSHLWTIRSKASKYLHEQATHRVPLRCIEDGVVPIEKLSEYVAELRQLLKRHNCDGAIFGHIGDGHLHVNPNIDVTAPHLPQRLDQLMEDFYSLVLRMGGSISGEHGDGVLRRRYVDRQWSSVMPLFQLVKETFDPAGLLNPGKKISLGNSLVPPYRNFLEMTGKPRKPSSDRQPQVTP